MTDTLIIVLTAIIIGLDFLLRWRMGEPGTISWRIAYWSQKYPLIPLAVGVLMGHLFFGNAEYCK